MDTRHTVDWRGRQIATTVTGDGPPVVLCHGTPFSSQVWEPIVSHLAVGHTVHRWDMPGYGASSKHPDHAVDLDSQAAALTALVKDHWELSHPVMIAHDIGGAVAVRAHLVHGLDLSSLVLVDAVLLQPWGSPFYALAQQHTEVFQQLPAAMHRALLLAYLDGAAHRPLGNAERDAIAAAWLGPEGQAAFYRQIAQVRRQHTDDLASRLDDIRCQTHVIWGVEDTWLPIDNGRLLSAALTVDLIEIPEAGHLVQHDQPDVLAAHLRSAARLTHEPYRT